MLKHPALTGAKVRFAVVNSFTAASLILGFASLIFTMAGLLTPAALCVLGAVLLDGCDGNLARKWRVASSFGAQLDSMADMTAFGVATAMLAYYWLMEKEPAQLWVVAAISGLVALTGAIRLARFNVTPKNDAYFQGIPTTFAAAVIAAIYLTTPNLPLIWGMLFVALLAILMVSAFPYWKFAQVRRFPKWLLLVALFGALINPSATTITFASVYMGSGPVLWLKQRRNRRMVIEGLRD